VRIKSYFAASVQDAIEKARVELGPDAMLMNSKKTEPDLRALGAYEVVFGLPGQTRRALAETRTEPGIEDVLPPKVQVAEPAPSGELVRELADLRKQIETVRRSMSRRGRPLGSAGAALGAASEDLTTRLVAADFSEEFAAEISEAVDLQLLAARNGAGRLRRQPEQSEGEMLEQALYGEFDRRLDVAPGLGVEGESLPIVAFAGPAGAGKTTSLIKLALQQSLRKRVPLQILSLDTMRVGGWEQLASYARITGLAFDVIHNQNAFAQALEEYRGKKLILIDTPGLSPAEVGGITELASWFKAEPVLDVHLVLSAISQPRAARQAIERFSALRPSKLLFTHFDEAASPATLLEIAIRAELPISYLADGQQVPEDIHDASKTTLLEFLGAPASRSAASAA
jgi:flagellar biosynthesis protein FlhF